MEDSASSYQAKAGTRREIVYVLVEIVDQNSYCTARQHLKTDLTRKLHECKGCSHSLTCQLESVYTCSPLVRNNLNRDSYSLRAWLLWKWKYLRVIFVATLRHNLKSGSHPNIFFYPANLKVNLKETKRDWQFIFKKGYLLAPSEHNYSWNDVPTGRSQESCPKQSHLNTI